jgi:hypothetical protein
MFWIRVLVRRLTSGVVHQLSGNGFVIVRLAVSSGQRMNSPRRWSRTCGCANAALIPKTRAAPATAQAIIALMLDLPNDVPQVGRYSRSVLAALLRFIQNGDRAPSSGALAPLCAASAGRCRRRNGNLTL